MLLETATVCGRACVPGGASGCLDRQIGKWLEGIPSRGQYVTVRTSA